MYDGDVPLMISLQAIVKRFVLLGRLYCLLQLKSRSRLFVHDAEILKMTDGWSSQTLQVAHCVPVQKVIVLFLP